LRLCDNCKRPLPLGCDFIEVTFHGKFSKIAKTFLKTDNLHFCSIECFESFSFKMKRTAKDQA